MQVMLQAASSLQPPNDSAQGDESIDIRIRGIGNAAYFRFPCAFRSRPRTAIVLMVNFVGVFPSLLQGLDLK